MHPKTFRLLAAALLLVGVTANAATLYVNVNGVAPTPPYATWASAATNIQDAVDAANPGDLILVTNGVYRFGGILGNGTQTNRVAVLKPLVLRSLNGPTLTSIEGYQIPGFICGNEAVRCVYLTDGAVLSGFTITNGATRTGYISSWTELAGGGVYCESTNSIISNCILVHNTGYSFGGGGLQGTFVSCVFSNNSAGPAGDVGPSRGGGALYSTLINCSLTGNQAYYGGGADGCLVINCTLAWNTSQFGGGGARSSTLNNSILHFNSSLYAPTYNNYDLCALSHCCTIPMTNATGSITNDPTLVDSIGGNFHLSSNSPCINAGANAYVRTNIDLDGSLRIKGGTVDIGAYEFQSPASILSYAWSQQYGLPTDGSADFADPDHDGMNNWQEWKAGTSPLDSKSLLKISSITNDVSGMTVTWQSVSGITYYIQRSADPATLPLSSIQTGIPGQPGTTSFTDTGATGPGPFFYRIGVQ